MAELPELMILQQQMNEALSGRVIERVDATQPKCLNVSPEALAGALTGRTVECVTRRGKWFCLQLNKGFFLLLNLGMGADLRFSGNRAQSMDTEDSTAAAKLGANPAESLETAQASMPGDGEPDTVDRPENAGLDRYHLRVGFTDETGFTCRFWWFGHVRLFTPEEMGSSRELSRLGPSPLEVTSGDLCAIAARSPRGSVKSLLLDQEKLSGIGNAYAHDILWKARLSPTRRLGSLSTEEVGHLHDGIRWVLERAIEMGGLERDFYGGGGNLENWERLFLVGYREGKPCPRCETPIEKRKTGSTSTFLCPCCQSEGAKSSGGGV